MKNKKHTCLLLGLVVVLSSRGGVPSETRPLPRCSTLNLNWLKGFGDDQLNELIVESLSNSPNVRMAAARLGVLETQLEVTRAERVPSAEIEGGIGFRRYNPDAKRQDPDINRPSPELSVGYETDIWGRFSRGIGAARAARDAGSQDVTGVQLSLAAEVARCWLQLRAESALYSILDEQREIRKKIAGAKLERVNSGFEIKDPLWSEEELLGPLDLEIRVLEDERERLSHRLDSLCGKTASRTVLSAPPLREIQGLALPLDISTDLVANRPDVRAAALKIEAQRMRVGAIRAASLPAISLVGKGFFSGDSLREFLRAGSLEGFLASQFTVPLLNRTLNRRRVEEARAEFTLADEEFRDVVVRAFEECNNAVSGVESARSALTRAEELSRRRNESVDVAKQRADAGLLDRLAFLPLKEASLEAEKETVRARLTFLEAQIYLAEVLALGASA